MGEATITVSAERETDETGRAYITRLDPYHDDLHALIMKALAEVNVNDQISIGAEAEAKNGKIENVGIKIKVTW